MPEDTLSEDFATLDEGLAAARAAANERGVDAALPVFDRVRAQFPQESAPVLQAEALLRAAGRADEADALLREAVQNLPDDARLGISFAMSAYNRRDFAEAARRWRGFMEAFPDDPTGYVWHATCLREAGRLEEAEQAAGAAWERFPDDPGALSELAWIAQTRQDWETAVHRWERVRLRQPDRSAGYLFGAFTLHRAGRSDEADELLVVGAERFPDDQSVLGEFAWIASHRLDFAEAAHRFTGLRERFPTLSSGYYGGAFVLRHMNKFDEAEDLLQAGLAIAPESLDLLSEHARLAAVRNDWPEAAKRWQRLLEISPDHAEAKASGAYCAGRAQQADVVQQEPEAHPEQPGAPDEVAPEDIPAPAPVVLTPMPPPPSEPQPSRSPETGGWRRRFRSFLSSDPTSSR